MLGKPSSQDDARKMLQNLSGRTHQVYTGYAIQCIAENHLFSDAVKTDVKFKQLTDQEIEWYIHTKEPFDKAGAYAIQGLGTFLVREINGSYTNVVGLPVCEVIEHLLQQGVITIDRSGDWS
jgi:septum formation protein